MKLYLAVFLIFFLTACFYTEIARHKILGSSGFTFYGKEVKVLLDAQVGNLRIREVEVSSITCHSGYRHHIELDGAGDSRPC